LHGVRATHDHQSRCAAGIFDNLDKGAKTAQDLAAAAAVPYRGVRAIAKCAGKAIDLLTKDADGRYRPDARKRGVLSEWETVVSGTAGPRILRWQILPR